LEVRVRVGSETQGLIFLVNGFWFLLGLMEFFGFDFWWVCFGFWIWLLGCDDLGDKCVIFIRIIMDFGYDLCEILLIDDQSF
jgi:hypothetical protein